MSTAENECPRLSSMGCGFDVITALARRSASGEGATVNALAAALDAMFG